MPLTTGDKLGPYKIVELIGVGGMGEVYRAHDPRVGRDVAIKVAAGHFSQRFEREARVIASLNHSNICHLYDVGPNYLAMELVEGETFTGHCPSIRRSTTQRRLRSLSRRPMKRALFIAISSPAISRSGLTAR